MRYAIVQDGAVVNVVEWDGDPASWTPPEGSTAVALADGERVQLGDAFDPEAGSFAAAVVAVAGAEVAEAAPDYRAIAADPERTVDERFAALLALLGG